MRTWSLVITLLLYCYCSGQVAAKLTVPLGHKGPVSNCYFSANDRYLVSTDYEHALCIWDGNDGRQLFSLRDNNGSFIRSSFNASTVYLTALTDSGKLYIINFPRLAIIKTFEGVRDFSISPLGNMIFFIDSQANVRRFDPVSGRSIALNCKNANRLKAVSTAAVVVQQGDNRIILLNQGISTLIEYTGGISLLDIDGPTNRILVSKTLQPRKESYILCLDLKTKKILHELALGVNARNVEALFTANKDHIIATWINADDESFMTTITEPSVYSLRTGELLHSLRTPEIDLSLLNLNRSRRRLVVIGDPAGAGFADKYIMNIDLLEKDTFYFKKTAKTDLYFAVANNSSKRALFDKDLLLPVIYPDGNMDGMLNSAINQYPEMKLDLAASKATDAYSIKGLLRTETAINDSVILYTSSLPYEFYDSSTAILTKRNAQNSTDSFVFTYQYIVDPTTNSNKLFWAKGFTLYILDIASLWTDSIKLPETRKLEGIYREGDYVIIKKESSSEEGFGYKYSIPGKKIIDSAFADIRSGITRPYREVDYSHETDGFPISQMVFKDFDRPRNIMWEYPFRTSEDTVAIYDSTRDSFSYSVVRSLSFLKMSSWQQGKMVSRDVADKIGNVLVQQVRYWKENKYAILTRNNKLFIYSVATDSIEKWFTCKVGDWAALFVLPNNDILISDKDRNSTFLINVSSNDLPRQLKGYFNPLIRQKPGLLLLQDASFGNYYLYSENNYRHLCDITLFSKTDYIVSTSDGLFDGTEKAMENIYFLVNDPGNDRQPWRTIDLKQLKAKYYIPGLFDKLVSGDYADLPDVENIKNISLAPDITTDSHWSFKAPFSITLEDKGGGIGPVSLVINGKEVIADARNNKKPQGGRLLLSIDLNPFRKYFNSSRNSIQVFSTNTDSSLSSRGTIISSNDITGKYGNPKLFVISIGTSDYKGTEIDLQYSSKDAADMALAFKTGGSKLFGADSTIVYTVSSLAKDSSMLPSKGNIERIFQEVARLSTAKDIMLVYLSGHGISKGNEFYYLTRDAYSANASTYIFKELLSAVSISSSEFTEYLKRIAALKQLFIIDACASGKVVENLVAHRDIPFSTLKALDRMKDRTGTHVITGCAADAVSYEASRFGQGLLTYSLLEGMKGASLRENKFLDVSQWFQYARDRVPQLANGLGGIQTPQVCSPQNSESFDVAEVDEEGKKTIPLAREKPIFIKSSFQEEEQFVDILSIGKNLDNNLVEISARGSSNFLFLPVDDFPGSYQVLGRYRISGGNIIANIRVIESSDHHLLKSFSVSASAARELTKAILEKIRELP